jgi:hypothetical protein
MTGRREGAPAQTGRRKQVRLRQRHRWFKQILPREESAPEKPSPCVDRGDPIGEA